MRQLTKTEIEKAPEWANSFFGNSFGNLFWFNNESGKFQSVTEVKCYGNLLRGGHYAFKNNKPIRR